MRSSRCGQLKNQPISQPLMIALMVVVLDEFADYAAQRALADEDHTLDAGLLDGPDEAFRMGVQIGRPGRQSHRCDTGGRERVVDGAAEEWIAVVDEKPCTAQKFVVRIGGVSCEWSPSGHSARH